MATAKKNLNRFARATGVIFVAAMLSLGSGCALQDGLLNSRGNKAFQDLVQQRFDQSHPAAQSMELQQIVGDIETQAETQVVARQALGQSEANPQQGSSVQVRAQSPDNLGSGTRNFGGGQGATLGNQGGQNVITPEFGLPGGNAGSFDAFNPLASGSTAGVPLGSNYADLDVFVTETQTGNIQVGGAFNSENGIVGQFIIDERNFDITALPRSFRDIVNGTAFRGDGQAFRLELVPGRQVQRYLVSWSEPYLFDTNYSLSVSGYLFDRRFFDWDEQRVGGRISLGRRLTPDLSFSVGLRLENVDLDNPRSNLSPTLNANLGESDLYLFNVGLVRDTRDHPFLPTEGSYLSATYTQGFGDFDYPRGDLEYRRYRLMYERPDGSGRHTVSFSTRLGFTGSATPIFENYFAGGFSTLRGYDFRGAAPIENGVRVGGEFQWLNSVEYTFPITADDMIKGVAFVDFGTIEEGIELNGENFRVAPGVGLRIHVPALGGGAPLAFDFAFPVNDVPGDEEQVFSFYISANN